MIAVTKPARRASSIRQQAGTIEEPRMQSPHTVAESIPGRRTQRTSHELRELRLGKATLRDLELLGVSTVQQLAGQSPDGLFERLQTLTGHRQDPCVWDVFAAAICQARTGVALPWWEFTLARKEREARTAKGARA